MQPSGDFQVVMSEPIASQIAGAWREGYRLVVRSGAKLPDACIKCGRSPSGPTLRKTFYWQPTGFVRLLPFPFSVIALLVGLLARRKITVDIPLCPTHRRKRKVGLVLTCIFGGIGLVLIGIGLNWAIGTSDLDANNAPLTILSGLALLLIGALCFVFAGRLLAPKQIDAETATFSGAGVRFLQLLPTSPNPAA